MRSRSLVGVGLLVVALLSPAFAEAPGWVLYTHADKLMSVRFPGKPIESNQDGASQYGKVHLKVATFIDGDRRSRGWRAVW